LFTAEAPGSVSSHVEESNTAGTLILDAALNRSCLLFGKDMHYGRSGGAYNRNERPLRMKCAPNFIIIGAMKCGTGELMKLLNIHPQLVSGKGLQGENEMHFFTDVVAGNENRRNSRYQTENSTVMLTDYIQMFPYLDKSTTLTFDKSPDYIRSLGALQRIKDTLSMTNLRLIVLLRNPVLRALSAFQHNCRHKRYVQLGGDIFVKRASLHGNVSIAASLQYGRKQAPHSDGWIRIPKGTVVNVDSLSGEHNENTSQEFRYRYETVRGKDKMLPYPCSAKDFLAYVFLSDKSITGRPFL
jgi:hypothetical protein